MICSMWPAKACEEDADAGVAAEPIAMMPSAVARNIDMKIEVRNMTISCGWYEVGEFVLAAGSAAARPRRHDAVVRRAVGLTHRQHARRQRHCPAGIWIGFTCVLAPANAAAGVAKKPGAALSAIASKAEVRNMTVSCDWYEVVEHPA